MASSLKTNDSLSIDSSIWYLEITANYTYGNASEHNENISEDSALLTIPVSNCMISMDDINTVYEDMIDSVRFHFYSVADSVKHLLSVAVKQESLISAELTIKVTSTVISGPYTGNFTFQPWENWYYGAGLGMCNGQYQGQDAASVKTS
jgi:hypothetical protein